MGKRDKWAPGLNKLHIKSLQQLMELVGLEGVHLLKGIAFHMISHVVQHLKKEEGPHVGLVTITTHLSAARVSRSATLEMSKQRLLVLLSVKKLMISVSPAASGTTGRIGFLAPHYMVKETRSTG